ncbi:DUF4145 domain-containing protein [Candidatus Woesearchaeota archaeon]|nr:DUF4145 domain-containing protein [Candidatus Woesearchaeota archaeon]
MELEDFRRSVSNFNNALNRIKSSKIDLNKPVRKDLSIHDFKEKQKDYQISSYRKYFSDLKSKAVGLSALTRHNPSNSNAILEINKLISEASGYFNSNELDKLSSILSKIASMSLSIKAPAQTARKAPVQKIEKRLSMEITGIPLDIKTDVESDLDELDKCFKAGCFRSAVILCGRLLETALHRKYYESTGIDLLEKSPGIGLGKIIAKLTEKNIHLDPGLAQQIHLINNVRVFSVHKKQEPFKPSKAQTQAIMLYTVDVLRKIFRK